MRPHMQPIHRLFAASVLICLASVGRLSASPTEIHVSDYQTGGAEDSTNAIQAAINVAAKIPGSKLVFECRIYDVHPRNGSSSALIIPSASGITIEGNGAILRVRSLCTGLFVRDSSEVSIRNLTFEWYPLPYAQARIVSFSTDGFRLKIVGGSTPDTSGSRVTSLFQYDEENRRPAPGINDCYKPGSLTPLEDGMALLKGFPSYLSRMGPGTPLLVRYDTYGGNAISCINVSDLTVSRVTVHSVPGMALLLVGCENVQISDLKIAPKNEATDWISASSDGIHATQCRGAFEVVDSKFVGAGDDAINVGGLMFLAVSEKAANQVVLRHGKSTNPTAITPPRKGDILRFSANTAPYKVLFTARVISDQASGLQKQTTVLLDREVPPELRQNAIVVNASACPVINFARVTVVNNRARGLWLQGGLTGNVTDCILSGCSGPAVELRADVFRWWEGPPPVNVRFTNCRFEHCNYGPGKSSALINTYVEDTAGGICAAKVIDTVEFENCDFVNSSRVFSFRSIKRFSIVNCTIQGPDLGSLAMDPDTEAYLNGNNMPLAGGTLKAQSFH